MNPYVKRALDIIHVGDTCTGFSETLQGVGTSGVRSVFVTSVVTVG